VRELARKHGDAALAQLAYRMTSAIRFSSHAGDDPFAKVKSLISGMIERLEEEAEADATKQAWCEKETAETETTKSEKSAEIEKLSAKIDSATARNSQLKNEIAAAQKALAELAASQAQMDKIREEEKAQYDTNKPEMEAGLEGVKLALKILNEYYGKEDKAHEAADTTGDNVGIIGMLEVVESDFSKGLAEMVADEESAVAEYEQQSKENEITKATTEKDVEYKTKESAGLEQAIAELSSDRDGVQSELDAALEYLKKLEDQCIAKPDTYEMRKARREAEIAGLKDALEILSSDASSLIQRTSSRRALRGHA
jgi:chromosome segregation ATPase